MPKFVIDFFEMVDIQNENAVRLLILTGVLQLLVEHIICQAAVM